MKQLPLLTVVCLPFLASLVAGQSPGQKSDEKNKSIKVWLEALGDPSPEKRQEAISALEPVKAEMVPALIEKLSNPNPFVRAGAAEVLGSNSSIGRVAVPALGKLLDDNVIEVRRTTARILNRMATWGWLAPVDGKALIPALEKLMKGDDWACRIVAADILVSIDPARKQDAIAVCIEALKNKDLEDRFSAAANLAELDRSRNEAIPYLISKLKDENYRQHVTPLLEDFGSTARPALPALRVYLSSMDIFERCRIARAIVAIAPEEIGATLPVLIAGLKDRDARSDAAMGIAELGVKAKAARPALLQTLAELGPAKPFNAPANLSKQEKSQAELDYCNQSLRRVFVLYALARIDPQYEEAIPQLIQAMGVDDSMARCQAIRALGNLGARSKAAVPDLMRMLSLPSQEFNTDVMAAARTLGQIGPAAKPAIPLLRKRTADLNTRISKEATEALMRIEP